MIKEYCFFETVQYTDGSKLKVYCDDINSLMDRFAGTLKQIGILFCFWACAVQKVSFGLASQKSI